MYLSSAILALIFFSIIVLAMGYDPLTAFQTLAMASLGGYGRIAETFIKTIPLLICGLAVTIAFKANFWNIGVEGQLYWGAIAFTGIGLYMTNLPPALQFLLAFLLAFLAGGFWAFIPGALKAYLEVNEIITTIMLNYIAFLFVDYLVSGPWKDPMAFEPLTRKVSEAIWLPTISSYFCVHYGLVIAIICVIATYIILNKSSLGYEIRVVGSNIRAARIGGIKVAKIVVLTSFLSGGLGGICGACEIAGIHHRLLRGISPGYGFLGIIIALLAKNHPIWNIPAAFFFAILVVGTDALQRTIAMPAAAVYAIQALVALSVLVPECLLRRWKV